MPTPKIRYRLRHTKCRNAGRKKNYASTGGSELNRNHGLGWTYDDIQVLEQWPYTDRELHKFIGRSVQAIQVMRNKLIKKQYREGG